MKYDSRFRSTRSPGERGVALFFALGILAVLIVTVLVFADRARTDLKISNAYASNGQAKNFAESALARALIQLQKNTAGSFYFYSNSSMDTRNTNTVDWLWKIETDEFAVGTNNPTRWRYVYATVDGAEQIIGRYAYHAVAFNPMDLNALLIHQKGLCNGSNNQVGGTTALVCAYCDKRLGRSVAELTFAPSFFTSAFTKDILNSKQTTFANFDFLKVALNLDRPQDISAVNQYFSIGVGDPMKELDIWQADKDGTKYFHRFNLNRTDWDSITVDNLVSTPTAQVLTAIDKDMKSADFKSLLWLAKWNDQDGHWPSKENKAKQIAANLINYNRGVDKPVVSDVTPANWNGSNRPNYTGNKRSWYLNEAWVAVHVTAVPGIPIAHKTTDSEGNETIHYYEWKNPTMRVDVELKPEIINLFKKETDNWPGDASGYSIKTYGTIKYKHGINHFDCSSDTTFSSTPMTDSADQVVTLSGEVSTLFDGEAGNYAVFNIAPAASGAFAHTSVPLGVGNFAHETNITEDDAVLKSKGFFTFKDIEIDLQLVLYKGSEAVDYVQLKKNAAALNDAAIYADGGKCSTEDNPCAFSLEVNDPRHNLFAECWDIVPYASYNGGTNRGTLKKVNTKFALTGGDKENATDPAADANTNTRRISTAYIRHGQMESLWELGAIHRAAPWQTINLKKPVSPDSLDTDFSDKGGEAYAKGDFLLLDQVTFRSSDSGDNSKAWGQFGKINLLGPQTVKAFSWDALFRNGKLLKSYDSTATPDALYTDTPSLNLFITNLQKGIDNINSGNIYRRSDIFRSENAAFWEQFVPAASANDAEEEERICRFINLTKVNKQGFDSAVIGVIAQTIKDVGGDVEIPVDWDENGDPGSRTDDTMAATNAGLRSNNGRTAVAMFGTGTVPGGSVSEEAAFGTYNPGVDKITGTAKMTAFFKFDNVAMKWKLVRVKHEE
ncbi:MAG: hypothetical protein IKB16_03105 [Lentisphaeria bacterium]|nr:hypothetical protein [Lentisphaeria bacterium]